MSAQRTSSRPPCRGRNVTAPPHPTPRTSRSRQGTAASRTRGGSGMRKLGRAARVALVAACAAPWAFSARVEGTGGGDRPEFERVGTFIVCENTSCDRSQVETTVSEIVTASEDGRTLAYADSALGAVGFVDIADPAQPQARGAVLLEGSPTSVAHTGRWLLSSEER